MVKLQRCLDRDCGPAEADTTSPAREIVMPPKRTKIPRNCEYCGREFLANVYPGKQGTTRFCGRPCAVRGTPRRPAKSTPVADRLWRRVDRAGPVPAHRPDLGPCWTWTGSVSKDGYGRIYVPRPRYPMVKVHRVAFELMVGPIPEGLYIDHLCHNGDPLCPSAGDCFHRRCVNPAHLEAVDRRENNLRGNSFCARHARQTHCYKGHEYTPENTIRSRETGRQCRTCRLERLRT